MKWFAVFYLLALCANCVFRIESWPLSNFSVYRSQVKLAELTAYRWEIASRDQPESARIVPFEKGKIHDSFAMSLEGMRALQRSQEDVNAFVSKYVSSELERLGELKKNHIVFVYKFNLTQEKNISSLPKDALLPERCVSTKTQGNLCLTGTRIHAISL